MPVQVQKDVNQYYKGTIIKHQLEIRVASTLTSPTTVEVYFLNPFLAQSGPFDPIELGPGRFIYNQVTAVGDATGTWQIRWVGDGNDAEGVAERQFYLMASSFST